MTRNEYLEKATMEAHREYYGQFVSEGLKTMVMNRIGKKEIMESKDEHMNDIKLERWDALHQGILSYTGRKLKELGGTHSLCETVCIAKEAARQIRESCE